MIKSIAVGRFTTFCITDNGRLYGAGDNLLSQLGLPQLTKILTFQPITALPADRKVIKVAADDGKYTLAWLDDHSLWATGYNEYGYLGIGSMVQGPIVKIGNISLPGGIPFTRITSLPSKPIADIAVKGSHSMVLLADGTLWVAGSGGNGELGLGNNDDAIQFKQVTTLPIDQRVVKIAAGGYGSFVQLEDGSLWSTGNNICGHLGIQEDRIFAYQRLSLPLPSRCIEIAVGSIYTFFLLEDGSLWSMGDNSSAQLGSKPINVDSEDEEDPNVQPLKRLTLPVRQTRSQEICKIYTGWQTTFILLADGNLWATGDNELGQLGMGETIKHTQGFIHINPLLASSARIKEVAATHTHTVLLLEDNSLWCAGRNIDGQLGFGDIVDRKQFTRCPFVA